jgi:hypothetical protein
MTDFKKKRYDRLEKNFTRILCTALNTHSPGNINMAQCIVHDLVQAVIEVGRAIPNKTLKGNFFGAIPKYGDLMTLKKFQNTCSEGFLIDYDGHGNPVGPQSGSHKGKLRMDPNVTVIPSEWDDVPEGTTHVIWFNR